jgi:hypothetical protein
MLEHVFEDMAAAKDSEHADRDDQAMSNETVMEFLGIVFGS